MTDNRWVILGALFLARTSMGYQFQSIGAISPSLIEDLGIGHAEVGTLTGLFQSKRFVTLENDRSVPDRFLVDLAAGYTFSGSQLLDGLSLELNVTNLFDKSYIAVINSGGTVARGDNQTLLSGAPRRVYVTLRKKF